jgi:hypothetical protein
MNVLIVVCSLSIFTYAAFFGKLSQLGLVCIPIKDNSPPMSLTNIRAYTSHILKWLDRHFKKGRVYSWALLVTPYIAYEKQPVSLVGYHSVITQEIKAANSISKIFFLSILSGGAALFIPATWPLISTLQKFAIAIKISRAHRISFQKSHTLRICHGIPTTTNSFIPRYNARLANFLNQHAASTVRYAMYVLHGPTTIVYGSTTVLGEETTNTSWLCSCQQPRSWRTRCYWHT